ncbi:DUF6984 family protein [Dyella jejuensis]|uniref:DUF6984 family protein n=1 Tax=Dyella jejuensis TaxID=1432009 RepID=UPI00384E3983
MRELKATERSAVLAMARVVGDASQREQLLRDLEHCHVELISPDGGCLIFHIDGYDRPHPCGQDTFRGEDKFPVEGVAMDKDGSRIMVYLYSDPNRRVLELELVKISADSTLNPDWSTFELT